MITINRFSYSRLNPFSFLFLFLFFFFSFGTIDTIQGQVPIAEHQEVINSIAKYSVAGRDQLSSRLKEIGYKPPKYLRKEFPKFPAVRKIAMAYRAAENAKAGRGIDFLAKLSKNIRKDYGVIVDEPKLKPIFDHKEKRKIKFKNPKNAGKVQLSNKIKKNILTLSKYTDAGVMGGPRGIMSRYYDLPDEKIFEILDGSRSNSEALKRGLEASEIPPSHKERLRRAARDLRKNYEGPRSDKALGKLAKDGKNRKSVKNVSKKKIAKNKINNPKKLNTQKPSRSAKDITSKPVRKPVQSKSRYKKFLKTNYSKAGSKSFGRMVKIGKGFGGIIFGNEIEEDEDLEPLNYIYWEPFINEKDLENDQYQKGQLQFIFKNGEEKTFGPVSLEDVMAAYHIVEGTTIEYIPNDGIGLAGIEFSMILPDSSQRWDVVIHPDIEFTSLGWTAISCDVLPIVRNQLYDLVKENEDSSTVLLTELWLEYAIPDTWKITDIPMIVSTDGNQMKLSAKPDVITGKKYVEGSYLTMQGFVSNRETNEYDNDEHRIFHEILPLLAENIEEFDHLNEFAQLLGLFRWAKENGISLYNPKPIAPNVYPPESVNISKERMIEFRSMEEEFLILDSLKRNILNKMVSSSQKNDELQIIHTPFDEKLKKNVSQLKECKNIVFGFREGEIIEANCNEDFRISPIEENIMNWGLDSMKIKNVLAINQTFDSIDVIKFRLDLIKVLQSSYLKNIDSLIRTDAPDSLVKFNEILEDPFMEVDEKKQGLYSLLENINSDFKKLRDREFELQMEILLIIFNLSDIKEKEPEIYSWITNLRDLNKILKAEEKLLNKSRTKYCP